MCAAYAQLDDSCLVLDLRPADAFDKRRLSRSFNIPANLLRKYLYLLPERDVRLGLLLPPEGVFHFHHGQPNSGQPLQEGASTYVDLAGHPSIQSFLVSRGWTNIAFAHQDEDRLWEAASTAQICQEGAPEGPHVRQQWLLRPCPQLQQQIGRIEQALANASTQRAAGGPAAAQLQLRCLDVGCGSGRDLAWLCCREAAVKLPDGDAPISWWVQGVDSWHAALRRAFDTLQYAQAPPGSYQLTYAEVREGVLQHLPAEAKPQHQGSAFGLHAARSAGLEFGLGFGGYDLVLLIRFLDRALLGNVHGLLAPGGVVLVSTFLDCEAVRRMGQPKGEEHILQPGELAGAGLFGDARRFAILHDGAVGIHDGRQLCCFVAQKTG